MCPKLPKSMTHTLKEVLDFSLLRQTAFLLTCIANVLGMMGFFIPFVYITDSSVEKGIGKDPAAFLLSIIGMTNLIGRLLFGWFVDKTGIKALNVNNLCLVISGIAIFTVPFCYSYGFIVTACTFFSFFVCKYILQPIKNFVIINDTFLTFSCFGSLKFYVILRCCSHQYYSNRFSNSSYDIGYKDGLPKYI